MLLMKKRNKIPHHTLSLWSEKVLDLAPLKGSSGSQPYNVILKSGKVTTLNFEENEDVHEENEDIQT